MNSLCYYLPMGFEDRFVNNIDRRRQIERRSHADGRVEQINSSINRLIPTEYNGAKQHIAEEAVDIDGFRDLYGEEVVNADTAEVKRLRNIFAREGNTVLSHGVTQEQVRQLSEISESFLLRGLNEARWVPHCGGIKTSEYDDYKNGVDLVLEFQKADNPASHIGLGVDVTFSNNLARKLTKIKEEIATGKLASVKYFDSPNSHMRGQLRNIPRGVVGFDVDAMQRISSYRQAYGEMPKNDPLRSVTFHQLSMQMRRFAEYGEKVDSPSLPILKRTSQFVDLLASYVKDNNPYFSKFIQESEQVGNFVKTLEGFDRL